MTKILVLNVGRSNRGNQALVESTIATVKTFVPDATFNLLGPIRLDCYNFQVKEQVYGAIPIRKPYYVILSLFYLCKCVSIKICKKFKINIHISKNSQLFDYYDCDIVINSGGDQLSGESGISTLASLMNILYPILLDNPVVLYGESLGYFKNSILNRIAKFVLNRTNLILVREDLSKKYLDENNITNPKIYVTADPAYLLEPVSQSHVLEIFSKEGINKIKKPLIGINPSGLVSRRLRCGDCQETEEGFVDVMARVIDELIEKLNVNIILIPHVYTSQVDDRISMNDIFHKVKNKSKVKLIKGEYSAQELKGIIGQCDLFVGARMHATIAATSMLVPTIGIAYSHKMYGIMGKMLGQEKYILDFKELDYDKMISKINDVWLNREKIRNELRIKIPTVKDKAMLNGKLFKELLESLGNS